ncbi:hypothetical protein E5288_WYG017181 [Bos mutus]|uniref:Forkhead box protein O1 n=1 Tax=Bos mutus TaxID=72004 RepID=A0A6B0RDY2_9CETA|nr:hypothetical protein [Bos mutus]
MAAKLRAHQVDVDPDFAPQSRPRSCTWPLPQPDLVGDEDGALGSGVAESAEDCGPERRATAPPMAPAPPLGAEVGPLRKAKSSRRNAWGNLSYADLITKAIESAPDKRLTLSQIYDWMVRYVPYFKDKGDSNSSAGWKNSIRHNLSLHTRFIRVQNEGTGKSSWWMLNPEGGKTGKTPRRRAVSMDNGAKFLRIKGKASKKKQLQAPERSPDDSPPGAPAPGPMPAAAKWATSPASHASDDYEAWADFRGGGRPLLGEAAELEDDEALEALAPSSPLMYPSPASALSPALGARCPGELPRLAELGGPLGLHGGGGGGSAGLPEGLLDGSQDALGSGPFLQPQVPSDVNLGSLWLDAASGAERVESDSLRGPGNYVESLDVNQALSAPESLQAAAFAGKRAQEWEMPTSASSPLPDLQPSRAFDY